MSTKYQLTPSERLSLQSGLPLEERWPPDAPPLTNHAIGRYATRLPDDAVEMPLAWVRGEDVQYPGVVGTHNHRTPDPTRVRIYNHANQYRAVFVVRESDYYGGPAVATVYNGATHQHPPTRAYIRAYGPHNPSGGER